MSKLTREQTFALLCHYFGYGVTWLDRQRLEPLEQRGFVTKTGNDVGITTLGKEYLLKKGRVNFIKLCGDYSFFKEALHLVSESSKEELAEFLVSESSHLRDVAGARMKELCDNEKCITT